MQTQQGRQLRKGSTGWHTATGFRYTHIGRYARPAADTLERLADTLGVSCDYLLEGTAEEAATARFEDRELLRQFQEVEKLPDDDKDVAGTKLDTGLLSRFEKVAQLPSAELVNELF